MSGLRPLFLGILVIKFSLSLNGQLKNLRYEEFSMRDGLSNNRITALMQDSKGFLWIGTEDGLNRFDGKIFENFYADPGNTAQSLSGDWIICIEKLDNYLIIGTNNGLNIYDLKKDVFVNFLLEGYEYRAGSNHHINWVWVDRKNRVWLNANGELHLLDKNLRLICRVTEENSFLSLGKQVVVADDGVYDVSGEIFIPTFSGVLQISERNSLPVLDSILFPEAPQWIRIYPYTAGKFIGAPYGKGIRIYDRKKNSIKKIDVPVKGLVPAAEYYSIKRFLKDRSGQFWAATGSGLLKFDPLTLEKEKFVFGGKGEEQNQFESACNDLFEDRTGNIWAAGENGLKKISPNFLRFATLSELVPGLNASFPFEPEKIIKDSKNRMWIASWSSGIQVIDFVNKKKIHFAALKDKKFNTTVEIKEHFPGEFWISSYEGLFIYNEKENRIYQPGFIPDSLRNAFVILSHKDKFGDFWISFAGKGMMRYISSSGQIFFYSHKSPINSREYLPFRHASQLDEDTDGNLWMGHVGKSSPLVKLERGTNTFVTFRDSSDRKLPFNSGIGYLYIDPHNILWIGTLDKGLVKYHLKDGSWRQFTKAEGLCNNKIASIIPDQKDFLWIGTFQGLSRMDTVSNSFQNFYDSDGLPGNLFLHGGYYDSASNYMFLSQRGNVICFVSESWSANTIGHTPIIKKIKVEDDLIDPNTSGRFNYLQNNFDFEFTAVNLIDGHKNQYAYILEGFDKKWIFSGGRTQVSYAGIPPGSYTFKVRMAADSIGIDHGLATYHFNIRLPFWQSWWFIILCILFITGLGYSFYRMRMNRLMAVRRVRELFSQDLHDDIGSTLSSINILCKSSLTSGNGNLTESHSLLQKIQARSQKMLDAMDDLVWNTKPENDSLESLVIRMTQYAAELLEAAGIHYIIECPPGINHIKLSMQQKKNLYLIFKEALNNLAKYSKSETAIIRFAWNNGFLEMNIQDKGVGIKGEQTGNGLGNMRSRAIEMNAGLKIESSPGLGTAVTIKVPV